MHGTEEPAAVLHLKNKRKWKKSRLGVHLHLNIMAHILNVVEALHIEFSSKHYHDSLQMKKGILYEKL